MSPDERPVNRSNPSADPWPRDEFQSLATHASRVETKIAHAFTSSNTLLSLTQPRALADPSFTGT